MLASRTTRALHFAVRTRVLVRYLGQLLLPFSLLAAAPLAVAAWEGRTDIVVRYAAVLAPLAALSLLAVRVPCTQRIQRNEALVLPALAFILTSAVFAVPLTGYGLSPLDAFFESVSGMTTTGHTVLSDVSGAAGSLHFARAYMQWLGGLGVVVLALAILFEPGVATRRLGFKRREAEDVVGGTRAHARRVLAVYVALTLAGLALLVGLGLGAGEALLHVLAGVSTGGFSSHGESLAALPGWPARLGTLGLSLLGAISFRWYYSFPRRAGDVLRDGQLQVLLGAILVAAALVAGLEAVAQPAGRGVATLHAFTTALSAQTTSGYATAPAGDLSPASKLVLVGSMSVGGEIGSTAGGIKILRLLILARLLGNLMMRTALPSSARVALRVGQVRVSHGEIQATAALALSYGAVLALSWLAFLACGHDPIDSLFEVASALGTVGLSTGLTGPDLAAPLKAVLCADMLFGRVEVIALLVVLHPPTWIGRRRGAL